MNRLQAELQRLYASSPDGRVRAMVLELARPASWTDLASAWRGVQADLELPAPAIAVSGSDSYQLWFSLAQPVPVTQALAFLEALRRRYLGHIAPDRIAMRAGGDAPAPGREQAPGRWSAFVAADLAAVFADEPWIDLPPGPDAQAELLSGLAWIPPEDWKRALERLGPVATPAVAQAPTAAADGSDPRRFLLEVMNDSAIEMRLRVEAAKALLPCFEGRRP